MQINTLQPEADDRQLEEINKDIENFVQWIFQHHRDTTTYLKSKVIHDGVWGTHRFENYEIAVINTPLIQRLRQIHQTAYTYFTYPSTQHTRFEHTLGVTAQIGNLYKALEERFSNPPTKTLITKSDYKALRIAALLHDCGHGPMSHSSEEIYRHYDEFKILKRLDPFKSAKAHEILSYLISNSEIFKKFLKSVKAKYEADFDEELMRNAIVKHPKDQMEHYKIDMLSGPFDADKLDYLFRDGHFSGLPLQIDLDRLWYSLDVSKVGESRRLTIDWGGISTLEQILFSKMTLYPTVYQHHKVRTCDCMFKGIIEYIMEKGVPLRKSGIEIDFSKAVHFLYFTDPEIFGMHGLAQKEKDTDLHNLMHNLQYRRLLKRAVVISRDTIIREDINKLENFSKYSEERVEIDGIDYYRWIAKRIWEEAGKPGLKQELWVDCPKDPNFDETSDTWISPLGEGQESIAYSEFNQTGQYANQYKFKKWRAHVFCRPEDRERVADACIKVFKELYDIKFKPIAFHLCHMNPPKSL